MQRLMIKKDAVIYTVMGETMFDELILPFVPRRKIFKPRGHTQIYHYDVRDLDARIDQILQESEADGPKLAQNENREKRPSPKKGDTEWAAKSQDSLSAAKSGTPTKSTEGYRSALARSKQTARKQSAS